MANPALGTKRICGGCAAKFYDLGKNPIVCPTCDTVFIVPKAAPPRTRGGYDPRNQASRSMGTLKEAPAVAEVAEVAEATEEKAEAEEAGGVPMLDDADEG